METVDIIFVDLNPEEIIENETVLRDHNYGTKVNVKQEQKVTKEFAKCEECRRSRTKVLLPNSLLLITDGKNDGKTCDFCGSVMIQEPKKSTKKGKTRNYVDCDFCCKTVLKDSLPKHIQDVHEKSNQVQCNICEKILAGPFSLKEHVKAIHEKSMLHQCEHCQKSFANLSNMNRHVKLVHENTVVSSKYVNCEACGKVVQATSLKKHMKAIHEKAREHICTYCNKGFSQSYTLKVAKNC